MSTRCQIVITDAFDDKLFFYRHSDGYPEVTQKNLESFLEYVKAEHIRDNAEQAAGWLIIFGAQDYAKIKVYENGELVSPPPKLLKDYLPAKGLFSWKVGAYEPCSQNLHGDIRYFYHVNLETKTVTCYEDMERVAQQFFAR
jgi:hypothetical protein